MENILDTIEEDKRPKTNYKKWSFRLFLYAIIAYLVINYKVLAYNGINPLEALSTQIMISSIIIFICLPLGLIFTILSYLNKEERNYEYYISIFGIPSLLIFLVLSFLYLK